MNNYSLSKGLKFILIILILFNGFNGVSLFLFQNFSENLFGAKYLDPKMAITYGALVIGLTYLFILGYMSNSRPVVKPMMQSSILFCILMIGHILYDLKIGETLYPQHIALKVLGMASLLLVLYVWGFILSRK